MDEFDNTTEDMDLRMTPKEFSRLQRMDFDFQEFSFDDLNAFDGKGGWTSGSYEDLDLNLDPTWLD